MMGPELEPMTVSTGPGRHAGVLRFPFLAMAQAG